MIEPLPSPSEKVVGFKLPGKPPDEGCKTFVPTTDAVIAKQGKARLPVQFHDFQGWDLHALWDDIKFATTHRASSERIALVGEKRREQWMAKVCRPFTMAKVRYSDASEIEKARAWVNEA